MKYDCDLITDLLPLYKDDVCSASSKMIVEEHLAECDDCKKLLGALNDNTIDETFKKEKEDVIHSQAKFFKRKSVKAGSIISLILAVPILICFIVDIANGGGLSWFFIVLAAMLIPASLIVVPLMTKENRFFKTFMSFTASLIVLLAVCCLYSHGNWFFVATASVLFGLTVVFSPFICFGRPVKDILGNKKGLAIIGADSLTFLLLITCVELTNNDPESLKTMLTILLPNLAIVWLIFAIFRYLPANALVKIGSTVSVLGLYTWFGTLVTARMTSAANSNGVISYYLPSVSLLIVILAIGAMLIAGGIIFALVKGGKKNEKA